MPDVRNILLVLAALAAAAPAAHAGRNIFDDDWAPPPPKRTTDPATKPQPPATPATATGQPPTAAPSTPTPGTTGTSMPPTVAPPPAPAARKNVPGADAQAVVRKLMRDVYAKQLLDRTVAGRRALGADLLAQADRSGAAAGSDAEVFVLLAASVDAAAEGADLATAFRAADRLAALYDIDAGDMKLAATAVTPGRGLTPQQAADAIAAALALADELAAAGEYEDALRACAGVARPLITGVAPPAARAQLTARQRDLTAARDAAAKIVKDMEALKARPDDPAVNLAVGSYLCFVKGDFDAGLPLLAKSSDGALKGLAAREAAGRLAGAEAGVAADGWWELALQSHADPVRRAGLMAHAADLYRRALDGTVGLRRQLIEKRLADAAKAPGVAAVTAAAARARPTVREVIVEALIDGDSTLHLTPTGLYWKSHGVAKPGRHDGRHEPTYVDGVPWTPKWAKPGDRGHDTSDAYALAVGDVTTLSAEVVACSGRRGENKVNQRDPIKTEVKDGELVVTIPDRQGGSQWYRLRITRK